MNPCNQLETSRLRELAGLSIDELAQVAGRTPRTVRRWETGETTPPPLVIKYLTEKIGQQRLDGQGTFRFIDLFAGIGGLRRGFEAIGGECIYTSEWDKYAQITYRANYGEEEIAGDITKVDPTDLPDHDVLLAGFPCQPFSLAGVSKKNALNRPHGFSCEIQGTLFFNVASILAARKPRAFLLENVKNLVSHDKGRTFQTIRQVLEEDLGYTVRYKVIDARSWVPQHRERIFIAGFREPNDFTFENFDLPDSAEGPRLGSILHPEDGSEAPDRHYIVGSKGKVSEKYILSDHLWKYLQDYAAKHRAKGNGFGFGLCGPEDVARTLSARYHKDGSEILINQPRGNPRRLTPRECARLMGFDRPGQQDFRIPVSDTQAYRQF